MARRRARDGDGVGEPRGGLCRRGGEGAGVRLQHAHAAAEGHGQRVRAACRVGDVAHAEAKVPVAGAGAPRVAGGGQLGDGGVRASVAHGQHRAGDQRPPGAAAVGHQHKVRVHARLPHILGVVARGHAAGVQCQVGDAKGGHGHLLLHHLAGARPRVRDLCPLWQHGLQGGQHRRQRLALAHTPLRAGAPNARGLRTGGAGGHLQRDGLAGHGLHELGGACLAGGAGGRAPLRKARRAGGHGARHLLQPCLRLLAAAGQEDGLRGAAALCEASRPARLLRQGRHPRLVDVGQLVGGAHPRQQLVQGHLLHPQIQ